MKRYFLPLPFLFVLTILACKKDKNEPVPVVAHASLKIDTVSHISGMAGDTISITGLSFDGKEKTVTINGVNAVIVNPSNDKFNVIVPEGTSGKMIVKVGDESKTYDFQYTVWDCSYLKKLSVSNFVVTDTSDSMIRYTFDLTNNSDAYLDFKYRKIRTFAQVLQNYVSPNADGSNRDPAGGAILPIVSGVKDVMKPGEVFKVEGYAVDIDNYLVLEISGYDGSADCSDKSNYIYKIR